MRLTFLACSVALIMSAGAAQAASLSVHNVSKDWAIHHLYVSHYTDRQWGQDQLGDASDDTVEPGEKFTLTGIEPGTYDIKLVDETGDECVLEDIDFVRTPVLAFDGLECAAAGQ